MSVNLDRIEAAIEKLTSISSDLKSMIAVQDQRLTYQEKTADDIQHVIEQRRLELDNHLNKVYDTMRDQDEKILNEVKTSREEHNRHYTCLNEKISSLQKYVWVAIGGGIVISWFLTNLANYLKVFVH